MASQKTRQQSVNPLLPVKADILPPKLWNCCDQALQFDFMLAHVPGVDNSAADYLSRPDINPEDRIQLKLNDQIPVHYIEINLAANIPQQDDDEEDDDEEDDDEEDDDEEDDDEEDDDPEQQPETSDPPEQQQLGAINTQDEFNQLQSLLQSLANNQHQHDDHRVKTIQIIRRHFEPVLAGDDPSTMLTKITRRHHSHTVTQVCPQGDSQIIQNQLSNQEVQKMVRVLVNSEPLPNHVNFASSFYQKLV